jgi:hypothetical protein
VTRDELIRWLAGIVAMGLLTLVVDVIADLIQSGTTKPVQERIKAAARNAAGVP